MPWSRRRARASSGGDEAEAVQALPQLRKTLSRTFWTLIRRHPSERVEGVASRTHQRSFSQGGAHAAKASQGCARPPSERIARVPRTTKRDAALARLPPEGALPPDAAAAGAPSPAR